MGNVAAAQGANKKLWVGAGETVVRSGKYKHQIQITETYSVYDLVVDFNWCHELVFSRIFVSAVYRRRAHRALNRPTPLPAALCGTEEDSDLLLATPERMFVSEFRSERRK